MTQHKTQALERALDNLMMRVERGQELETALTFTVSLYGVSRQELEDAYHIETCGKVQ